MSTDIPPPGPTQDLPVTDTDRIYDLVDDHTDILDLPLPVVKTAIDLFRGTYERASLAGRGSMIGVAAAVRVSCQMRGVARSLDEIAAVTDSDPTLIAREAKKIEDMTDKHTTPVPPESFVEHWGQNLGIDQDTRQKATELLADVRPERAPSAAAAGTLWSVLADNDESDVTQDSVVQETHTSAYTLREVRNDVMAE